MKQIRVQRKPQRRGGPGEPAAGSLPTRPVSDTSAARDVLSRIDRLVAGR